MAVTSDGTLISAYQDSCLKYEPDKSKPIGVRSIGSTGELYQCKNYDAYPRLSYFGCYWCINHKERKGADMDTKFKEMKFKIGNDEDLNKRVQNILFDLGYGWGIRDKTLQHTMANYLFANRDGTITFACEGEDLHYYDQLHEEIDIDWLRSNIKETVEVDGKKYYLSDIKTLTPVEE